jgi:hypothetical protein
MLENMLEKKIRKMCFGNLSDEEYETMRKNKQTDGEDKPQPPYWYKNEFQNEEYDLEEAISTAIHMVAKYRSNPELYKIWKVHLKEVLEYEKNLNAYYSKHPDSEILSALQERGVDVVKTDHLYIGFYRTDVGTVATHNPDTAQEGVYFLENGKGKTFPCDDRTIFIVSGTEYECLDLSRKELAQLAKQGKIFSFRSSDLYAQYYHFSFHKELASYFYYGFSSRTSSYLWSIMTEIGLTHFETTLDYMYKFDICDNFSIMVNADTYVGKQNADTCIGKFDEGKWIAQTAFYAGEDVIAVQMFFDHKPSKQEVQTAFDLKEFHDHPVEIFTCQECNRRVNWLDLPGTLKEKHSNAVDRYCGC